MKPLKLKMCAFGSYSDEETLDFSQLGTNGLYLVTGETGSGKTTIFDAISYALFGKASGSARNSYKMLRSDYAEGRAKTYVELDFTSGGNQYRIRREIIPHISRATNDVTYTDSASLVLPDGTVIDRSRDADQKIIEVIGLDRDQFAQIVMIAQNDFLRFLQSGTDERVRILRRIFNTDALKSFQDGLKFRAKAKEDERYGLIKTFEKHGIDHNGFRQQSVLWENEIKAGNEELRLADESLKGLDKQREDFAAKIAVAEDLCKVFSELAQQKSALEKHTAEADDMAVLSIRHQRGEIAIRKVKPFAEKAAEAKAAYEKAKYDFESAKAEAKASELAMQATEKTIAELPPLDKVQSAYETFKKEWQEASSKQNRLTMLDDEHKAIVKKQSELNTAKKELADLERMISELPSVELNTEALSQLTRRWEKEQDKYSRLNVLMNEREEIIYKEKQLELGQSELIRLNGDYDSIKSEYDRAYETFILNQAGIIAETLCEGKPCPVCGSLEHPVPAKVSDGNISDTKLKELLANADKAKQKLERKSMECTTMLTETATLKEKLMQNVEPFLPGVQRKSLSEELPALLKITKANADEMAAKKVKDEKSLNGLKEQRGNTEQKQKKLDILVAETSSSVSTRIDRFLNDIAELDSDITWNNAEIKVAAMLSNTRAQVFELKVKKDNAEIEYNKTKDAWEAANKAHMQSKTKLAEANARSAEREQREQDIRNELEEALHQYECVINSNGFESEDDYMQALLPENKLLMIAKQLAEYDENGRRISRDIERLSKETADKEKPDLIKLKSMFDEIRKSTESLRKERDEKKLQLENKRQILNELKGSAEQLAKTEREYAAVKSLSDTANGKLDFETYAQMAYFERILRAANQRLQVMSQNRYVLLRKEESGDGRKRMGLEIEVADRNTGKSRSANSLSGGESFMASLSLALGLSDVVQQSAGGIHIDAMFIDEGFGSLDSEVLELSVRTLSNMANGNRIIGIISHVAELREQIDKQVYVEKTPHGSKIHLVV